MKLEHAQTQERELKLALQDSQAKFNQVIGERDAINKHLNEVRAELHQVTSERNGLQQTCNKLQATIAELEGQHNQSERNHHAEMQSLESRFQRRLADGDKVIPLTVNDAIETQEATKKVAKSTKPFETLDTSMFDEKRTDAEDFNSPDGDNLYQSTKVGRLRKFKGHKKTADIEAKENEAELNRVEGETTPSVENAETSEVENKEIEKSKAYSPNRSFVDLADSICYRIIVRQRC